MVYDSRSHIDTFKNVLKDDFHIIQRDIDFLEIIPKPYSKAVGIQMLSEKLNFPLENTLSIGDSTNDLDMLKFTKTSIAMGNSHQDLFSQVDYITTSIDHDGIEQALQHFHLI